MVRIFMSSLERKRTCSLETEQTLNLPRLFRVANSEGELFFKCVITQATARLLVENILRDSHSLFWSFCVPFVVLVALRCVSLRFFFSLGCYSSCKDSVNVHCFFSEMASRTLMRKGKSECKVGCLCKVFNALLF